MRLDKYLKVSRLIKRRTVAKDVCSGEKVSINSKVAKPSAEVKIGDVIAIEMKNHLLEVRVAATPANIRADEASSLYEVLRDEKKKTEGFGE
ncbi:RNA-binding S4 domain protein [Syntrophobotulus glycolicus DSM 8271]|uniref:RQC P-site tRNA stabilizing factor n=1 Tax=Syntrophobotulus glycolicus (strain DSM 8271 / FlGlyR) TaxID=645991 RepID=F0SW89_SYNGF|nr:RNA-binding S4 domain-containing protein [Syntrophobotulus glycolicus]ADY54575.1 RNA-binding S4 domain protein [Syntrophobotulus glycolicus DSM 8271]